MSLNNIILSLQQSSSEEDIQDCIENAILAEDENLSLSLADWFVIIDTARLRGDELRRVWH